MKNILGKLDQLSGNSTLNEGIIKDGPKKSEVPAFMRKSKGARSPDWKLTQQDLEDEKLDNLSSPESIRSRNAGSKSKLKDWMEKVEVEMIAEGKMSEVNMILQDIAAGRENLSRIMHNPKNPVEQYAKDYLIKKIDELELDDDEDEDSIEDALLRDIRQEFGDDLNEATPIPTAVIQGQPTANVSGAKSPDAEVGFVKALGTGPSALAAQTYLDDLAKKKLITVVQPPEKPQAGSTQQPTQQTEQLKEDSTDDRVLDKLHSILKNYPYESKHMEEGWGMHESLYQALCDHYWEEGKIPRDTMMAGGQQLRDWVEECYANDVLSSKEELIGEMLPEDDTDYQIEDDLDELSGDLDELSEGKEKWIAGAIKHPGALRKKLGAKEGKPIPAGKLEKATHSKDPTTAKQARLAQTLRGLKKESVSETAGVTDYNPKSQGGTRKELLKKYSETGKSEDATAARKAGATQEELQQARAAYKKELGENNMGINTKKVAEARGRIVKGRQYGADEVDFDADDETPAATKAEPAVKRGRGRPSKNADPDTGNQRNYNVHQSLVGPLFTSGKVGNIKTSIEQLKKKIKTLTGKELADAKKQLAKLEKDLEKAMYTSLPGKKGQVHKIEVKDEDEVSEAVQPGIMTAEVVGNPKFKNERNPENDALYSGTTRVKLGGKLYRVMTKLHKHEKLHYIILDSNKLVYHVIWDYVQGPGNGVSEVVNALPAKVAKKIIAAHKKLVTDKDIVFRSVDVARDMAPMQYNAKWDFYHKDYNANDYEPRLNERAVSKAQQQAAAIALKDKREGKKPQKGTASASMSDMSTAELEKFAGTKRKGLPKHVKEDAQVQAWNKELNTLLNEGMTITTSTGNQGGQDSVSISATDEDAQTLLKLIQSAGLQRGNNQSMSAPSSDVEAVTVEPVSADEVMGTLEPADDGHGDLSFIKRMLGARAEHGSCQECGHEDCQCDHDQMDEMHNETASSGDAHMSPVPEGEEVDEELHGGQKELDVAEPKGKLTKADFEALRAKKDVKEGYQPVTFSEESLDGELATMEDGMSGKLKVGDMVTIDPDKTSGYASSGMVGRIVDLYNDDGEETAEIAVGGSSGMQKKMNLHGGIFGPEGMELDLGRGVRTSGTHTAVPTSMLQKYESNIDEEISDNEMCESCGSYMEEGHECGEHDVAEELKEADMERKVFKQNGKPVGEIGIDPEASPGNGPWYVKHYASGYNVVGFNNAKQATEELKYCIDINLTRDQLADLTQDQIAEQGVAEGSPELLKAEMPLVRHIEKELAQHGYEKGTSEYDEMFKHSMAMYRKFGNVDAIKKGVAEGSEDLTEWANTRGGSSHDEQFIADIAYLTKSISGGLNNIKQDQTVVPSARVKTGADRADAEQSLAELLRKLGNIN